MNLWLIVVCFINYIGAECLHKMSDTHVNDAHSTICRCIVRYYYHYHYCNNVVVVVGGGIIIVICLLC